MSLPKFVYENRKKLRAASFFYTMFFIFYEKTIVPQFYPVIVNQTIDMRNSFCPPFNSVDCAVGSFGPESVHPPIPVLLGL